MLDPRDDIAGAAARAAGEGCRIVVAAGGDGTVSAVAGALAGTGPRLGVLPLGTFNFFARSLGIPLDIDAAWLAIAGGHPRPVRLGEIDGLRFVDNASLGAYASVLEARERVYARWGRRRSAAYWSVLVALATLCRPLRMQVTADGATVERRSALAFAALRPYQLDQFGLAGAREVEDGRLALYLAPDESRPRLVWRAAKVLLRRAELGADYEVITGHEITVAPERRDQLVAHDGERGRMRGPCHLRMLEDALEVMVPAGTPAPGAA